MSETYVKRYDVGNIRLDAPYAHFIYELPLLTFGDIQHTIGLSLVFNSRLSGSNEFNMSNGYKLNLQKRLIISSTGAPTGYEDGDGSLCDLEDMGNGKYTFKDDSQRIIRTSGNTFVLEYPDYSKETFTSAGKIASITDKYGEIFLKYTYIGGSLSSITYKTGKVIRFSYTTSGTNRVLASIKYTYNGTEICSSSIAYNGSAHTMITHYSGVKYYTAFSGGVFNAYSIDNDADSPLYNKNYYKKITCTIAANSFTIDKFVGEIITDEVIYEFPEYSEFNLSLVNKFTLLDTTDYHGVKTRIQYQDDKPAYSYEVLSEPFQYEEIVKNYVFKGSVLRLVQEEDVGVQKYADSKLLTYAPNKQYPYYHKFSYIYGVNGEAVLSGWLKPIANLTSASLLIYEGDEHKSTVTIGDLKQNIFVYFSARLELKSYDSVNIVIEKTDSELLAYDFRLTPHQPPTNIDDYDDHLIKTTNILIDNTNNLELPIKSIAFYNGSTILPSETYKITANDILRYKINQQYGSNKNEIYYNDCRGIISGASTLIAKYYDNDLVLHSLNVEDLELGKKYYVGNTNYVTKTHFYDYDSEKVLENRVVVDGEIYEYQRFDENLDVVVKQTENCLFNYNRNSMGLIIEQKIKDLTTNEETSTLAYYDNSNSYLLSTTDEFGTVTTYITDPIWGMVTQTALSDGSNVTETYSPDGNTIFSRSFGKGDSIRANTFTYLNGNLYKLENNSLNYTFGYSAGDLATVKRGSTLIAEYSFDNEELIRESWLYGNTTEEHFDIYGRLKKVVGKIENTYDIYPYFTPIYEETDEENDEEEKKVIGVTVNTIGVDNKNGQLASTTNLQNNNVTKYDCRGKNVMKQNSAGETIRTEHYTIDDADRQTGYLCSFNPPSSKSFGFEISYKKTDDHPFADGMVNTFKYKVNEVEKSRVQKSYDGLKRLTSKTTTIGNGVFTKQYFYDKTRINRVTDYLSDLNLGYDTYYYDSHGRITNHTYLSNYASDYRKYEYDDFGQLVRENNQALDKTFIYCYNNYGNISNIKTYDYTLKITPTGSYTEKTLSYNYWHDTLTEFGNVSIVYNAYGYPRSYGTKALEWIEGRLTRLYDDIDDNSTSSSEDIRFSYNTYGQRISKNYTYDAGDDSSGDYLTSSDAAYEYDGQGRLVREFCTEYFSESSNITREFTYLYDDSGIIGVMYSFNGAPAEPYYYRKNLFGDVVAIYDAIGNRKAEYAYDAFGNCKVIYSGNTDLTNSNPIRYRGYYYDIETKLYYLNERYYNPEWRRFISPDNVETIDPSSVNGLNLYCYANNNPIGIAYSSSNASGGTVASIDSVNNAFLNSRISKSNTTHSLPTVPWLVENATTVYGALSSLSTGFPIVSHYYKYASHIKDEFRLYGISKWKTSLQLSNVSFKMGALDGALIGINVLIDMYDSYQRGVSAEGIMLGGALTATSGIGLFYLNKGIMWTTTTIGTAICPGMGTAVGFVVGLTSSVLTDIFLGRWIADRIDEYIN